MDITIQGVNGHVKQTKETVNQAVNGNGTNKDNLLLPDIGQ